MSEMSETELLQAFRKERSEEAFAELVRRYAGLVYSVARRRLSSAALAEDVTQLVFIRFAKTPPKVHSAGELAAWLHRTTVNVTIDTWRSESRRRNREQEAAVMQPETNTSTTHAFWDEISPSLDEAIDQLNDDDRQAILLRFFKAKPMREVGTALGVSEAAAKMRVGRAVDKLRTQLGASAAATTAAVLAGVLTERSAEAAPVQLVSRLAAMKLPAAGAGTGALLYLLSRISGVSPALGEAGLALLAISLVYLARSSAPVARATIQASTNAVSASATSAPVAPQFSPAPAELTRALTPKKAVKMRFHVLDADTGAGLAETKIRFVYVGPNGQPESHDILTDDKGDAAITGPDDPLKTTGPDVCVTAEGYVPKAISFRTTLPADYTMKMDAAATASGVVVDEQGLAVPGVEILIQDPPPPVSALTSSESFLHFENSPMTNRDDGTWSCRYIPNGTNRIFLILHKPGYAGTGIDVPINEVGLSNLTLVIERGYVITGKITDVHGDSIANAEVKLLNIEWRNRQSTRSDENGAFLLAGIGGDPSVTRPAVPSTTATNDEEVLQYNGAPAVETNARAGAILHGNFHGWTLWGPLKADLAVQAEGFAPQTNTVMLTTATNTADFVLGTGNIFRGQVVDEAGNPISNAVVQTDFDYYYHMDRTFAWTTHTDADGWFQWNSAPEGEIIYWFEADGYEAVRGLKLAADGSEHRIVLKSRQ